MTTHREIAEHLCRAATEIANEGHAGWGNICLMAAEYIESQAQSHAAGRNAGLEEAAKVAESAYPQSVYAGAVGVNIAKAILALKEGQHDAS